MDNGGNSSNETSEVVPKAEFLEYAEIVLLSCMVAIGGPLNLLCFFRSSGQCWKTEGHAPVGVHKRRRNSKGSYSTRSLSLRLHLTAANLFIIWFYGISQICWLSTYSWLAGDFMCRLVKFLHTFCFYSTSNIVVMIAIDRVYVTANIDRPPLLPQFSHERWFRFLVCWVPWILAVAASLPQLFVWNVIAPFRDQGSPNWHQCVNVWVTWKFEHGDLFGTEEYNGVSRQETAYGLIHLVLVFWCPAFIVVCSYAIIVARFREKIKKTQLDGRNLQRSVNIEQFRSKAVRLHFQLENGRVVSSCDDDAQCPAGRLTDVPIILNAPQIFVHSSGPISNNVAIQTLSRVKRRTVWASACISFAYVACWSPYNILELWRFLDPNLENRYLELLSNLIVLNAVVNPLIYDTNLSAR